MAIQNIVEPKVPAKPMYHTLILTAHHPHQELCTKNVQYTWPFFNKLRKKNLYSKLVQLAHLHCIKRTRLPNCRFLQQIPCTGTCRNSSFALHPGNCRFSNHWCTGNFCMLPQFIRIQTWKRNETCGNGLFHAPVLANLVYEVQ